MEEEKSFEGWFDSPRGEFPCTYHVIYELEFVDDSFDAHNLAGDLQLVTVHSYEPKIIRIDIDIQYEDGHVLEINDYKLKNNDPNEQEILDNLGS